MTYDEIYHMYAAWAAQFRKPAPKLLDREPLTIEDIAEDITMACYAAGIYENRLHLFTFSERCTWQLDEAGNRVGVLYEEYAIEPVGQGCLPDLAPLL